MAQATLSIYVPTKAMELELMDITFHGQVRDVSDYYTEYEVDKFHCDQISAKSHPRIWRYIEEVQRDFIESLLIEDFQANGE